MDITIANKRAIITGNTSDTIFSQALTTLNFTADTAIADNTTVALITVNGQALARATTTANTAVLDTNTVECYQYAEKLPTNGSKVAYLVIGEADSIIGVAEVYVQRNMLADITPPTESVPIYPTSQELQAILETLQQAIDRVGEIENIVEGFDETVTKSINQINTATTDGIKSINASIEGFDTQVQEAISQVNTTAQQATESIAQETQGSLEAITNITNSGIESIARETTEATTTIAQQTDAFTTQLAVEKQAIAEAVDSASTSASNASTSATTATTKASEASTSATNAQKAYTDTNAIKTELQTALEEVSGVADDVANIEKYGTQYFSHIAQDDFNIKQGDVKFDGQAVWTPRFNYPLHEGFLLKGQYVKSTTYYYLNPTTETFEAVGVLGTLVFILFDEANNKTEIYSKNGDVVYLTTISGTGENITHTVATIDALPSAISGFTSLVYGWKTSGGFAVCTYGHILSSDLSTEVATFSSLDSIYLVLKNNDSFHYYNSTLKKFETMTLDENGIPSFSQNGYTQESGYIYKPTNKVYSFAKLAKSGTKVVGYSNYLGFYYQYNYTSENMIYGIFPYSKKSQNSTMAFQCSFDRIDILVEPAFNTSTAIVKCFAKNFFKHERQWAMAFNKYCVYHQDQKGNVLNLTFTWGQLYPAQYLLLVVK